MIMTKQHFLNIFIHSTNTYQVPTDCQALFQALEKQSCEQSKPLSRGVYILVGETGNRQTKEYTVCQRTRSATEKKRGREQQCVCAGKHVADCCEHTAREVVDGRRGG